jgi:hypothetical protein
VNSEQTTAILIPPFMSLETVELKRDVWWCTGPLEEETLNNMMSMGFERDMCVKVGRCRLNLWNPS